MELTLSEQTYRSIKEDIDTLVLSANEFLNEQQLAERYGISKAPIRAALHRLCMEGILVSHPRKGYLIVTLSEKEFQQVQALRVHNECYALALLAETAGPDTFDALLAIAKTGASVGDNLRFHKALAAATGSKYLEDIVSKLLSLVMRTFHLHSFDEKYTDLAAGHVPVIEALAAGDLQAAQRLLTQDILR